VTIFVDTTALYAALDRDDRFHPPAARAWEELLAGSDTLLTSNYIIVETVALVQRRLGMDAVRACADRLFPVLATEWITEDDHRVGLAALLAANRRDLSLVDCVSFRLMRRMRVRRAFTFDPHFAEQGFDTIPPREST
jgi:predicted nucleic acid-binding protein